MATATVTSKGQITIPAIVRAGLNISAGDRIEFIAVGDGKYEIIASTRDIKNIKGMIKSNKVITIEDMNQAISEEAGNI